MNTMKNGLRLAVVAALVLPVAAQAALQYTPPQAMVLTCNGSAPNVLNKTSALATFACANGQVPQAVGVTSGLGDLLGLASGASILAASEAVPQLALPSSAPASGSPAGGSPASGHGSNASGNGNGSNAGSNASGNDTGKGSGSNASGNGSNSGSSNGSSGPNSGSGGGSGSGSGSGSGGGFLGHLLNSVGSVVQRIGHAVVTGGTVNIPLMGGASTHAQGTIAENGGNNTGNTGYSGFNSLNHYTQASPTAPVSIMTGAAPGTIEIHSQPQPFVLTGGPAAYRGLVRWVSGFEGSVLDVGGGYLDEVVHPGTVTPERQPDGPGRYVPFSRLSGTLDFYITEPGHRSIAYPGNPVRFVSQIAVGMGNINASIWEAAQKSEIQATGTYSSGPQYYTSMPGNRNGPFWPSPFTLGGPEPDVAGVCHGIRQITHVSMGGQCWSTTP